MPEPLSRDEDQPPSRRMKRFWKVAVLANIKDDNQPKPEGVPPDAFADFDHIETVHALRAALETDGHSTVFLQADRDLPYALREEQPDICFNIIADGGPSVFFPVKVFEFQAVIDGANFVYDFVVLNKGSAPLLISNVRTG